MQGVFLDSETLDRGDLALEDLKASLTHWTFYPYTFPDAVVSRAKEAEVIVVNKVVLDDAILSQLPKLRLICVSATGVNNIDLKAARKLGITVCNAVDYSTPSVVQHALGLLLQLAGHLPAYQAAVANGKWRAPGPFCLYDFKQIELAGKTAGIIGFGNTGQGMAKALTALGMKVCVAKRNEKDDRPGRLPLSELFECSDVISLHCPLTPETYQVINQHALLQMKPTALLVNTARGALIDELALANALKQREIAGAALDVLAQEPPESDHPLVAESLPGLLLTPHIAWGTKESRQRLIVQIVSNIIQFNKGTPQNVVTL